MNSRNDSRLSHRTISALRAYVELIRLPNIFTAMADVMMGFLFVRAVATPTDGWALGLLLGASSLLYAAGVVLNDLFDFEVDAHLRPERPLPSGRISLAAARRLGWSLLILGAASAAAAAALIRHPRPGIVAGLLAAAIVAYDAWLKRTHLGPLGMGACRLLNVLLGMSVATAPWGAGHWLVAGGIGTYIAGVTWFARSEARRSSRAKLGLAIAVMMLGIAQLAWFPSWTGHMGPRLLQRWRLLMAILGVLIGWRCFRAVLEPTAGRVQAAVKLCILSLVVLDAAVCHAATGEMFPTLVILLLLVPAMLFGRWIHST